MVTKGGVESKIRWTHEGMVSDVDPCARHCYKVHHEFLEVIEVFGESKSYDLPSSLLSDEGVGTRFRRERVYR